MTVPTYQDILDAARRIKGKVLRTPFIYSDPLSRQVDIGVYLKLESLQPGGSFKFRGATNAVAMLIPEERAKGVVAASSGNHGTALALAASRAGIKATIVLPDNAPQAYNHCLRFFDKREDPHPAAAGWKDQGDVRI